MTDGSYGTDWSSISFCLGDIKKLNLRFHLWLWFTSTWLKADKP